MKIARYLIVERGAEKEPRDHLGRTPLYSAAEYGKVGQLESRLSTLLNFPAFQGQTIAVKLLKELECQVNVSNLYGQKAIYWIVSKCPEIVSL